LKRVILTGDDFGLALPVNEAIAEAHQKGILTTASLMVGAAYASDAIERARQCPSLKVGLHLTLVECYSVLPQREIPNLVDADGAFPERLAQAGFKFFFYPGIRKQLEAEIRAQFDAFRRTGMELDHVNAHNHMHLHPTILRLILKVGKDYGLKAVRLPNEPPLKSWRAAGTYPASRISSWLLLRPWLMLMKISLKRAGVRFNDFLFGMTDGGCMKRDLVERLLQKLPDGATELCFHPATSRCSEIDRTMPHYHHEEEFRALICERLRDVLQMNNIQTIAFSDL